MKFKKNFILFSFIIFFIAALYLNIYIINSKNIPELDFLNLKGIYFDLSMIDNKDQVNKIKEFIYSKDNSHFNSLVFQKDPVGQFYGFCGMLNSNENGALNALNKLLSSSTKVNIFLSKDNKKNFFPLGYAILLLIKDTPKELIINQNKNLYNDLDKALTSAYKSSLTKNNDDFKRELTSFISEKKPDLLESLVKETQTTKTAKEMSTNEKIESSFLLHSLSKEERKNTIRTFLDDQNDQIVVNTLKAINEDDSKEIGGYVLDLLNKNRSNDINKLAIEKYAAINKSSSLDKITEYLKSTNNSDVIASCLEQIKKYGNDSYYELLKLFLGTRYNDNINTLALETIVKTTYKTRPNDVYNTMIYVLRKGNESLATSAINFYMDNNIQDNTGSILSRLKLRESEKMERLALDYISQFKAVNSGTLLRDLSINGSKDDIKSKAKELINKLGIKLEDFRDSNEY